MPSREINQEVNQPSKVTLEAIFFVLTSTITVITSRSSTTTATSQPVILHNACTRAFSLSTTVQSGFANSGLVTHGYLHRRATAPQTLLHLTIVNPAVAGRMNAALVLYSFVAVEAAGTT
jgi:hypothetical protein